MNWKSNLIVVSAILILTGCQGSPRVEQAATDAAPSATQPSGPRAAVVIDGMACPFCTYNIQRQLEGVEGVERVDVSLEKGEATVTLSEQDPATAKQLREAVESAGFTPTEVRMP